MPTIEIVSLNSDKLPINQAEFDIAIIEEEKLKGHRGMFDSFLSDKKGIMLHLGNPSFKSDKDGGFFAGMIIDWEFESNDIAIPHFELEETGANQDFDFKFLLNYQIEVATLIEKAVNSSPNREAYFMTDYQFGSDEANFIEMNYTEFWQLHDKVGLKWNTLYQIRK